jgi:arylsulfatase A-like enzyme
VDFAETFLDAAGLPIPGDTQGKSLKPLIEGQQPADWRKSFYYHYYEYPTPHHVRPHYGVVTDRYKLVHLYAPDVDNWQLFDLKTDPNELKNVLDLPANKETVSLLKTELARLRTELKVPEKEDPLASGRRPE